MIFPRDRNRRPALAILLACAVTVAGCKKSPSSPSTAPDAAAPKIDAAARLAAARDELVHAEDALTKRYIELDKRRARLAKAPPAEIEAYNRDAAAYAADVEALKRRSEAVKQMTATQAGTRSDNPALEAQAQECLGRLRAAVNVNDWPLQVAAMEQALAQFRNTQAFAQISALAQPRLAAMNPAELEKAMSKTTRAASPASAPRTPESKSEVETLVQQLRDLINQPIQSVPKSGERVGTYNFHGGGSPLDYAQITRDELMRDRMTFAQPQIEARDHPGVYYRSEDTEFNLRLKWYYVDPTKPTKRLTDIEYDRIVDLCRRIAAAQKSAAVAPVSASVALAPAASSGPRVSAAQLWPRIEALKRSWPR